MAQIVKNLSEMQKTQVQPLVREDPLEKNGNPLQYSCLENSAGREPGNLQSMRSQSQT